MKGRNRRPDMGSIGIRLGIWYTNATDIDVELAEEKMSSSMPTMLSF